jgi:hypothetical protein
MRDLDEILGDYVWYRWLRGGKWVVELVHDEAMENVVEVWMRSETAIARQRQSHD